MSEQPSNVEIDSLQRSEEFTEIATKFAEIVEEVGAISKSGTNPHHGYDYMTEEDVLSEIRPLLTDKMIAVFPSVVNTGQSGDLTMVEMEYLFVDAESGQWIKTRWVGYGQDQQDKGVYKAYTGLNKYALAKTFLAVTGDDPERDGGGTAGSGGRRRNRRSKSSSSSGGGSSSEGPSREQQALQRFKTIMQNKNPDDVREIFEEAGVLNDEGDGLDPDALGDLTDQALSDLGQEIKDLPDKDDD